MAWISFDNRSADMRSAIEARAAGTDSTPQAFYDANELGLLDDAALLAWLGLDPVDQEFAAEPTASTDAASTTAPQREEDLYMVKTLGWLMQNANTLEDKVIARKRYRAMLFDLWRKYLAQTGETWYPPLRNDLWERYQFENGIVSD
jgi:hypothetical protein